MRTNIDIDDDLLKQALELTSLPTKRAVVTQALEELVARRRQLDLRDLFGQVVFTPGYDHKALRTGSER
jgi:Arc/MetJ family transcription regulator